MKHPLFVLLSQSNIFFYATDEDECAVNNGGCSHKCLNTEGSYECVCPKGFKVQYNQRVCVGECIAWWNQQHRRIFFLSYAYWPRPFSIHHYKHWTFLSLILWTDESSHAIGKIFVTKVWRSQSEYGTDYLCY